MFRVRFLLSGAALLGIGLGLAFADARHDDTATINDFEARVAKYLEARKKEAGSAPRPTNSADKLAGAQQDRATKVQEKLPSAQGDIFTREIAEYMRRQISTTLSGPEGTKVRSSLRHGEPLQGLKLRVNQVYPEGIPLQSTPPTLLLNLPPLPKDLEYRFVGRALVLHDTVPNLIVDFISDAIPPDKD